MTDQRTYWCTHCGKEVVAMQSRPSIDPRYAIARCKRHSSDSRYTTVVAVDDQEKAMALASKAKDPGGSMRRR